MSFLFWTEQHRCGPPQQLCPASFINNRARTYYKHKKRLNIFPFLPCFFSLYKWTVLVSIKPDLTQPSMTNILERRVE